PFCDARVSKADNAPDGQGRVQRDGRPQHHPYVLRAESEDRKDQYYSDVVDHHRCHQSSRRAALAVSASKPESCCQSKQCSTAARAAVTAAGVSSGAPSKSSAALDGMLSSATPAPASIAAVAVCRASTDEELPNRTLADFITAVGRPP